jgi:two-component system sensor histidine kinase KdpD
MRARRPVRRARGPAAVAVAITAPLLATMVGSAFSGGIPVASVYLLAVVGAAAIGGVWSGLAASALSFMGLNFFFTAPKHTFRVDKSEDIVALVVFLLVASIVGALLARAIEERARASRREHDTQLLNYVATRLLSTESLDRLLEDFAGALLDPFRLSRCEIRASLDDRAFVARADRPGSVEGPVETVELSAGGTGFGTLVATRLVDAGAMSDEDRVLLEAVGRQAASALDRAQLASRVRGAQLDAETNQIRAALFSSVTHDLRTPLASIKAGVTSLLDEGTVHDAAQRHELLVTIREETDRLNRLVGNLMDLARIRSGALIPSREPVALDEVAGAVLARLRPQLSGLHVRTQFREDVPEVAADPLQMDQVITNLVENAVRYSPRGGELVVSVARFRHAVQVRVTDHGPGIPSELRERVFEAFERGDASPGRSGTGLGLAIARAIVVAHDGRIWIEGAPAGGTAAVFEIPIDKPSAVPDAESR